MIKKFNSIAFNPIDNTRLNRLCGVMDEHLRQVEVALEVHIQRRNELFSIQGEQSALALDVLRRLYEETATEALSVETIQLGLMEALKKPATPLPVEKECPVSSPVLMTRRGDLRPRTPRQGAYLQAIRDHDITFGLGPAGTGKTYLGVASAVDALERDMVQRLILVRPAVEAGERLGFLPGDLAQKVDPYLRPLYDALYDLLGYDKVGRLFEKGVIEIAPLAYMRGRTLNKAFILLDEAQNTTPEQMKMFLTRIGFGSKAVITGDLTQVDLAKHQKSGLADAYQVLQSVKGLAFHTFLAEDVVRHPLVQKIVVAYESQRPVG